MRPGHRRRPTATRWGRRTAARGAMLIALAGALAACSAAPSYPDTPVPTPSPSQSPSPSAGAAPAACDNATASYNPLPSLPSSSGFPAGSRLAEIRDRGYLIAGVSADTLLLGSRNPLTGQIEGFDIDLVRQIARSIFGDADAARISFVVIQASQRIDVLQNRTVDLVARNMTMTCDRWTQVAFSSEYYRSGQKILVPKGSPATSLDDLAGQRVCAPRGTSTMAKLLEYPEVVAVGADNHTGCLVLFQQGEVDAITGDDTVLAGLAAQDPYAVVPAGDPITQEPYGLAFNAEDVSFVQYVNTVLAQMRADGRWSQLYATWLAPALGPGAQPPAPVYGRG